MVSPATSLPLSNVEIPEPRQMREERCGTAKTNVGEVERRVVSVLGGSMLVASGIRRMSLPGLILAGLGGALIHRGSTGQCAMYKTLGVTTAKESLLRRATSNPLNANIRVEQSVIVNKPVGEVYAYWRKLENLPKFMNHLEEVKEVDKTRSMWKAKAPRGRTVEWNADIVEEEINKKIAWKSVQGADVPNAGQVLFEEVPGGGTKVTVVLVYGPPAGVFGAIFAKLFGEEPNQTVKEDLARFKQIMEP